MIRSEEDIVCWLRVDLTRPDEPMAEINTDKLSTLLSKVTRLCNLLAQIDADSISDPDQPTFYQVVVLLHELSVMGLKDAE